MNESPASVGDQIRIKCVCGVYLLQYVYLFNYINIAECGSDIFPVDVCKWWLLHFELLKLAHLYCNSQNLEQN